MEADPDFLGPAALAKGMRFVGDPRDAIAKLGAEAMRHGIDSDLGAKHAKWFVTSAKTTGWLRETELVPKTQGIGRSIKEVKFAMGLARHGKVPPPGPVHAAKDVGEARALYDLVKLQGRDGAAGIVQGERALSRLEHGDGAGEEAAARGPYGPGSFPKPYLLGENGDEEEDAEDDA